MKHNRIIRFQIYSLRIDPSFWSILYETKLNIWKLDDSWKECFATIKKDNCIYLDGNSLLDENSSQIQQQQQNPEYHCGIIKVFNTKVDLLTFHSNHKSNLLKNYQEYTTESPSFIILVYADLKQYTFDYFFALPTMSPSSSYYAKIDGKEGIGGNSSLEVLHCNNLLKERDCFVLPWIIRNQLFQLYQKGIRRIKFCNETKGANETNETNGTILVIKCQEPYKIRYNGWYSGTVTTINMSQSMDPHIIAEQNAELNLKLMMWKHEPNLPLNVMRKVKCLLLGSGTVGCSIARNLIAWGVKHITFVDCSTVSYSNPVRQNLYSTEDIGKEKAPTAAENLLNILPSVQSNGITLNIPMPGHNHSSTEEDYLKLDQLIESHDIIVLSTDSREGRWLPILLAKKHGKQVLNIALGYETFLVQWISEDTACYFCTDPIGPRDTMSSRTIDEKCTITRPGISMIASAIAVELFVDVIRKKTYYTQIRFTLPTMNFSCQTTEKNDLCSCCSQEILSELLNKEYKFIEEIKLDPSILEYISGYNDVYDDQQDITSIGSISESIVSVASLREIGAVNESNLAQ